MVLGVFWTTDYGLEPTVVLGYCGDPLECWGAVVLWCQGGCLFASAFRKLPMLEFVDLVNSTCLGRVFFVLSHQGSQGKGQVLSPQDSTLAPDGHQPSAVLGTTKYIYSLVSCHGCALGFF